MLIQSFPSGPFLTNAYVVSSKKSGEALFIDPAPGSFPLVSDYISLHSLKPLAILLTHSHWDHIADVSHFLEKWKIPLCVHALDKSNLISPGSDGLPLMERLQGVNPTNFLSEGEEIACGELRFLVIHTPGHSPGSLCFFEKERGILFSGDTLFQGTIGNLSFPTSQPHLMARSLQKLALLPTETIVYPGHGSATTIGSEKKTLDHYIKSLQ